jgi:hypothetical protein
MTELETKAKLDQLSDFQAHRDLLDSDKRTLLEDVKVPEEVQAIVSAGMKRMIEAAVDPEADAFNAAIEAELLAVVIPEEIKVQLTEIDRTRAAIMEKKRRFDFDAVRRYDAQKRTIQSEIEAQTAGVYAAIATRKAEIEAEFAGKSEAVDENIRKLTEEIKADIKTLGVSVKGTHLRAEFTKPKKSWIPQLLDAYTEDHPDIKDCYTLGESSVAIKRI